MIALFFVLLFSFGYSQHVSIKNYKNQLQKFRLENLEFEEEINKNGERLILQEQIILSQKDAINQGLLEIDRLKKVKSQVNVVTQTIVDTFLVNHIDTIVQYVNGDAFLKLPQTYSYNTKHLDFNATINKTGLLVNNISIGNKSTITIGYESQGIFKKPKPMITIKNDNPYIQTNDVSNIVIEEPKSLINDKKVWGGVGFLIGILLN